MCNCHLVLLATSMLIFSSIMHLLVLHGHMSHQELPSIFANFIDTSVYTILDVYLYSVLTNVYTSRTVPYQENTIKQFLVLVR
jgi:hypothetical protein